MESGFDNFGLRRQYYIDGDELPKPLEIPGFMSMWIATREDFTKFIIGYKRYVGRFNYLTRNCGLEIGEPLSVGRSIRNYSLRIEDDRRDFLRREFGCEYDEQFPWDDMGNWLHSKSYFEELETFSPFEEDLFGQVCDFFYSLSDILGKVHMELEEIPTAVLADILLEATSPPTLVEAIWNALEYEDLDLLTLHGLFQIFLANSERHIENIEESARKFLTENSEEHDGIIEEHARKFFAEDSVNHVNKFEESEKQIENIEESTRIFITEERSLTTEIVNSCGEKGLVAEVQDNDVMAAKDAAEQDVPMRVLGPVLKRLLGEQQTSQHRDVVLKTIATKRNTQQELQQQVTAKLNMEERHATDEAQRVAVVQSAAEEQHVTEAPRGAEAQRATKTQPAAVMQRAETKQPAASADEQQLAVKQKLVARVDWQKLLLPRQCQVGRPHADKRLRAASIKLGAATLAGSLLITAGSELAGLRAATENLALQGWQPGITETCLLEVLLGMRRRARALEIMVFGAPGPPGVEMVAGAA